MLVACSIVLISLVIATHASVSVAENKLVAMREEILAKETTTYVAPGTKFDLSNWQLQLPIASGSGVKQVQGSALKSFASANFYLNTTTNAMTFWAPENGAHTSGSLYPRSELRELAPGFPNGDWKAATGTHEMNVTLSVLKVPQAGGIVIGQVHADGVSGHCSVVLELEYTLHGTLTAYTRDSSCGSVETTVGHSSVGAVIEYQVEVKANKLTVKTNTGSTSTTTIHNTYPIYFKVGAYVQDSASSSTQGGTVAVTKVSVSHK